jgi:hypothetical protein
MPNKFPFCVVLDSNVWVTEHLLQTTIGSAALFAVSAGQRSLRFLKLSSWR